MNRYVIGDIHGNYKGLLQAIERSSFNPEEDLLISLGDLVDGGVDSYEVVEYLSSLKHCILIKGNHDEWLKDFLRTGIHGSHWTQGASKTAISYINNMEEIPNGLGYNEVLNYIYKTFPQKHKNFLFSGLNYYLDGDGRLFVHGGFDRNLLLDNQLEEDFYWDRELINQAMSCKGKPLKFIDSKIKKVFLGHTTTMFWKGTTNPIQACSNVWNLDTGAGSSGKVTIMNVKTQEYWQSDLVKDLYGNNFTR